VNSKQTLSELKARLNQFKNAIKPGSKQDQSTQQKWLLQMIILKQPFSMHLVQLQCFSSENICNFTFAFDLHKLLTANKMQHASFELIHPVYNNMYKSNSQVWVSPIESDKQINSV